MMAGHSFTGPHQNVDVFTRSFYSVSRCALDIEVNCAFTAIFYNLAQTGSGELAVNLNLSPVGVVISSVIKLFSEILAYLNISCC